MSWLYLILSILCFVASLVATTYFLRWYRRNATLEPLSRSEIIEGLVGNLLPLLFTGLGLYLGVKSSLFGLFGEKVGGLFFLPLLTVFYIANWERTYREWHFPFLSVNRALSANLPFMMASVSLHAILLIPCLLLRKPETNVQMLNLMFPIHLLVLPILVYLTQRFCPPLRPLAGADAANYRTGLPLSILRYATGFALSYTLFWVGITYLNALQWRPDIRHMGGVGALSFVTYFSGFLDVWSRNAWKPTIAATPLVAQVSKPVATLVTVPVTATVTAPVSDTQAVASIARY